MSNRVTFGSLLTTLFFTALLSLSKTYAEEAEKVLDVQNDVMAVTLFRGAANNSWFEVYFNALPIAGAGDVEMQVHAINLRPER
ncbi:hypothetical protein, partial [Congregibacter sp.]|uniref:hypothetical protein n=1 Tax=Congregibacter sp. TaxID=2744308 RepID=UPI0039E2346B